MMISQRSAQGRPRSAAAAFTLVEVMIAMSIAIMALLGYLASLSTSAKLQIQTQHYGQASRAMRWVHESLRNRHLDARVDELKAAPTFEVGDVSVEVRFPAELLERVVGGPPPIGWRYRDLDGDGEVELDPAATSSASLLPVSVIATWSGGRSTSNFMVTER